MYGICKGNMDESFDNPIKLQYFVSTLHTATQNYHVFIMYWSLKGMWKET